MIAGTLRASGKRTGLAYEAASPFDDGARVIDGLPISREQFAGVLERAMPAIERTTSEYGHPTYYETLLALTFAHFAQEKVDVAVIEVGLGGRLDGTNVLHPVVAAITLGGLRHTESSARRLRRLPSKRQASQRRAYRWFSRAGLGCTQTSGHRGIRRAGPGAPSRLRARRRGKSTRCRPLQVLGTFQRTARRPHRRSKTADGTLRLSRDAILRIFPSFRSRTNGVGAGKAAGRLRHGSQRRKGRIARRLFAGKLRGPPRPLRCGDRRAENARRILEILATLPSTFTFTSYVAAGRRAIAPSRLSTIAESIGRWGRAIGDPVEALTVARRLATMDDVVVVTGSTFVVGELREWFIPATV